MLAKRKIGVEVKSAAQKAIGRPVLYGTGEAGSRLKREVLRRAAEQSERLYAAMVNQRKQADKTEEVFCREDLIFDPTSPKQTDWEQVLSKVAEKLIENRKKKDK